MMNICVFTHTYPRFSGDPVAPFMKDFCESVTKQGNNVYVVVPFDKQFIVENENKNPKIYLYKYIFPKNLHLLGYSRTLVGDQKFNWYVYLLAPLLFFFSFIKLLQVVRQEKIDVISAHWLLPNGFIASLVSILTKVPLIITVPGSDVYFAKKNALFCLMAKFALKIAKIVTSNSRRYIEELIPIGIDLKKFREIPYGVKLENFELNVKHRIDMRKRHGFSFREKIILSVGRMVEKKGFEYLIRSIPYVVKNKRNIKFVIIGDGILKKNYIKLTENLNISDKIIFLGNINHTDLPKYYSMADIYVAPSIKDSKGNLESNIVSLLEAIASGLPIVATKLGSNKEYIINGKSGYRVNDRNEKEIAKAIISLLSVSRNTARRKNREIAKKYLSLDKTGGKFQIIFEEIMKVTNN